MNVDIVMNIVSPYVESNCLTYDQFENSFCMLSQKEKYVVLSILREHQIELVDELPNVSNETEKRRVRISTEKKEENKSITDNNQTSNGSITVKQSNEILCLLLQKGDKSAAQDLCIANRGLVAKYASAGAKSCNFKVEFDDLMQVGYIGLLTAAEKYQTSFDTLFSTYATWWIKQRISREIMNSSNTIRVPVHQIERINRITKEESRFLYEDPDKRIEIVAKNLGLSEETVRESIATRDNILTGASLNAPANEAKDNEIGDLIPNLQLPSTEEVVMKLELKRELDECLKLLTEREERILRLRFGLDDGRERTLEEIGQIYGLTRERIRQIEQKALRKLRHPSRSKRLKDFLD